MKQLVTLFVLGVLLPSCTDQKIFREVALHKKYGNVELGDDKADLTAVLQERNGKTYLLPKTFAIAREIELVFNSDNKVEQITFYYPPGWNQKAAMEKYTSMLGEAVIENGIYVWNDGATKFILYTKNGQSYTSMIDVTTSP